MEQIDKDIYRLRWQAVYLAAGHRNLKSFAAWIGVTEQHLHYVIFRDRPSKALWETIISKLGYDPRTENGEKLEEVFKAMVFHPMPTTPTPKEETSLSEPGSPQEDYYHPGTGR